MNRNEFTNHVATRTLARLELLRQKGAAYSGDQDAFANFKRNAEKLGLTPYQIWAVYCGKHLDAIFNAIRSDPVYPVDRSEGLTGRIDDAINYLELLGGLLSDRPYHDGPTLQSTPSNADIAEKIAHLLGGNGLSTNAQLALVKALLDEFYGPRHFSL